MKLVSSCWHYFNFRLQLASYRFRLVAVINSGFFFKLAITVLLPYHTIQPGFNINFYRVAASFPCFPDVSMLFSPCLKIFGTNFCGCFVSPSVMYPLKFLNIIIVANLTECHFLRILICVPQANFRRKLRTRIDWGRRWLTGPGSLNPKIP